MRPGVVTWNPILKAALASGMAPLPIMEVFWGMGLGRSVIAGARLGVFGALSAGARSAEELADELRCDLVALGALLAALNGFGYLRRAKGKYALSRKARRWLLPDQDGSLHYGMLMLGDLFAMVEPIEGAIRSGEVTNFHHRQMSADSWNSYLRGLGNAARYTGPFLARAVSVDRPPERILDVAGGHGMYSAALCRRFPGARSEVLDLPEAVRVGEQMVAEEGLSERIHFRAGDLRHTEWGAGFDVVLLFNILHNLTAPECRDAVARAHAALRPGGTLVIADSEHSGGDGDLSAVAGFNELFFFMVSGAQAWPEPEMRGWMKEAGFAGIRKKSSLALPGLVLLSGRR